MFFKQKTLCKEVSFEGIGVHSALPSRIVLKPSAPDSGIVITSMRFPGEKVKIGTIVPTRAMYATVIRNKSVTFSTIEHVMAALKILNIDNVLIEVEGEEFPILDGSSFPFTEKMMQVGVQEQAARKIFITPRTVLFFEEGDRSLMIIPAEKNDHDLRLEYDAAFDNPLAGPSTMSCSLSEEYGRVELAPARTFGFLNQLPFMKQHGLAQGASLENTVVISETGVINEKRFNDECLRHKVLDLVGDLTLLGKSLIGTVKAKRTGHAFNRLVIEHFVNNPHEWIEV